MNIINIGLCADNRFTIPLGVCVLSILESNTGNSLNFHIISCGIDATNKKKLTHLIERHNQCVFFYEIEERIFEGLPISSRFPLPIYFRFLFEKLLPLNIDRLLYLDSDMIVLGSLQELFDTDLKDTVCGVVYSQSCDAVCHKNRIENLSEYFNSGVLLLNLSVWRSQNISQKCFEYLNSDLYIPFCPDQDALNAVFANNVTWLSWRYNFQEDLLRPHTELQVLKDKWKEIDDGFFNIVIMHFCSEVKPWHKDCLSPMKNCWLNVFYRSPWANERLHFKHSLKDRIRHRIARDLFYNTNPLYLSTIETKWK